MVKHYFGHISGVIGQIDVKREGSASVGYWAQYITLTFDLPHDLVLGCFKVKFRNSSFSGIVGLINVKLKTKWVNMILGGRLYDLALWPYPWPWPWSWNFKVRVWDYKNPLHLDVVDWYLRRMGIKRFQTRLRRVWNRFIPHESQVSIYCNQDVMDSLSRSPIHTNKGVF